MTDLEIQALYSLFGNKEYPVNKCCIGCLNCKEVSFPCLNCASYVFDYKLGKGNTHCDLNSPLDTVQQEIYESELRYFIQYYDNYNEYNTNMTEVNAPDN